MDSKIVATGVRQIVSHSQSNSGLVLAMGKRFVPLHPGPASWINAPEITSKTSIPGIIARIPFLLPDLW